MELKEYESIVVHKVDKSNLYVIMNRTDYKENLNSILSDRRKFKEITSNPVQALKVRINKIIKRINAGQEEKFFSLLLEKTTQVISMA